ncbi:hypothetical protein [Cesiribacter andamanensis]|uniref:SusE outer membrane protein domain-containing protein n=1 Tax=Cesiribacter andamanensis AMV16 TaxID=1279009 RepID=M7NH62_9BACT|nr:hypothetical protein [Cesiribacter andamanensis]EMR01155.1 hypothetical protein ADICEAN_03720 [Cesiribacter andamanensis AMV16]
MKKLIAYISLLFLSLAVLTGCEDEDAVRVPDLIEGASLRVVFPDPQLSLFNFDNPEQSRIQFDLYTQNRNIDSVNIYATYLDASEGVTYPITPQGQAQRRQLVKTYRQSDFNSEGAIKNATITLAEAAAAFGLQLSDIEGADVFNFYNQVVLTDGRRFPESIELPDGYSSNTVTPDIAGRGVQTSSFNAGFTSFVACSLPSGYATGRYRVEQIGGATDPFSGTGPRFGTVEVTVIQTSPIGRQFALSYYGFDNITFNYQLVCGELVVPKTSSGLACTGSPALAWRGAPETGQYQTSSDDEFIIELQDNVDAGCGLTAGLPVTLKLTKI